MQHRPLRLSSHENQRRDSRATSPTTQGRQKQRTPSGTQLKEHRLGAILPVSAASPSATTPVRCVLWSRSDSARQVRLGIKKVLSVAARRCVLGSRSDPARQVHVQDQEAETRKCRWEILKNIVWAVFRCASAALKIASEFGYPLVLRVSMRSREQRNVFKKATPRISRRCSLLNTKEN
jgi:hypothetical protein